MEYNFLGEMRMQSIIGANLPDCLFLNKHASTKDLPTL